MTEPTNKSTRDRPQRPGLIRENVGGVEIVRDRRDCDVMADSFHTEFLRGDSLALFQCMVMWQEEKQPFELLPTWVIDALAQIAVTYYREQVEWIENEAREWTENAAAKKAGEKPSEKELKESKPKRRKKPRSFEKIAGISHVQGKPNAWKFGKDDAMGAYFYAIVAKAKSDPKLKHESPLNKRLKGGKFLRLRTLSGGTVRILNDREEPTEDFESAVAELFGLGSGKGKCAASRARTFRRHMDALDGADK